MKRFIPLFTLLITYTLPVWSQNEPKTYAMVIGISNYTDENITDLKFADKDARAFAAFLETPYAGAVPKKNISLLVNEQATRGNIFSAFTLLLSRASKEDVFIFYFAGHGKNDQFDGDGYFLPYDAVSDNEAGTAIGMEEIKNRINRCKAKMKISYVDACHAGLFRTKGARGTAADNGEIANAYLKKLADATEGQVSFLSSTARQQSQELSELGHGIFTYYLLKGLSGEADKEQKNAKGYNNGTVTIAELQTYLNNKIPEHTGYKQKPSVEGDYDDDFPLSMANTTALAEKTITTEKAIPAENIKEKGEPFANLFWEPVAFFNNQLFASMIVGLANNNNAADSSLINAIKSGSLGFKFISNKPGKQLKWEIESSDKSFFDKARGTFTYEKAGQEVRLMPNIPWNYSSLAKLRSSTPVTIIYRLFDEQGNMAEKIVPISIRSINECVFQYKDLQLYFLFTAYIQEEHPEIDNILSEALKTNTIKHIAGYQGSETDVLAQVSAIWRVLHDRGFKYSSITTTAGARMPDVYSQSVRTFDNAIKTNQANAVDGTVVFASILRKIGISPVMVLTSNHCFLGFYTNAKKEKLICVETTMLSDATFINQAKTPEEKEKAYAKQFVQAVTYGNKMYNENKAKGDVTLIDVDEYRKIIKPIPFY